MARIWIKLATFASFVILARGMSAHDFGAFGVVSSALFVATALGSLGLRQSVAYEIGQAHLTIPQSDKAIWQLLPLGAVATGVVFFLMLDSSHLGLSPLSVSFATLAVLSYLVVLMRHGIFLGSDRVKYFTASEVSPRIVLVVGVAIFAAFGLLTIETCLLAFSVGFLYAAVRSVLWTHKIIGETKNEIVGSGTAGAETTQNWREICWQLLRRGWPYAVALTLILLNTRVSIFLLSSMKNEAASGQFFAGIRLNEVFLETATAIGLGLFSHGVRGSDARQTITTTAQIGRVLFPVLALLAVLGVLFAPFLTKVLLGKSYISTAGIIAILVVGMPFAGISRIYYQSIASIGLPRIGIYVYTVAVGVNVLLSSLLLRSYGLMGGAVALVMVQIGIAIGFALIMSLKWSVPFHRFFMPGKDDMELFLYGFRKLKKRLTGRGS